jgi:hypothetical protein
VAAPDADSDADDGADNNPDPPAPRTTEDAA